MTPSPLVTTSWLQSRLGDPDVAVVDASWYLPTQGRDARAEYGRQHIPGAVFFDIDQVSDRSSPLPHMLPSAEAFAAEMGRLGLSEARHIVVYDGAGLFSAARVWWTFGIFGACRVSVLDGGLPQWLAEGRPLEAGWPELTPAVFHASLDRARVVDADEVARALASSTEQVVDARSVERFRGTVPEPRPGLRSGHMPGSLNLPFSNLLDGTRLKAPQDLLAAMQAAGVDPARPTVTSCGSGVTAAVLALALAQLGAAPPRLYDGSWAEWGDDEQRPVATGVD